MVYWCNCVVLLFNSLINVVQLHDMLSHDEFGAPLGHKHLSELLRLELGGEVS